jgi:mono/diheme cytochrome c family protein
VRKLVTLALAVAVIGGFGAWYITRPAVVSARALGPHVANLDNGRTMFHAGNCSSCHATPNQDDSVQLGGGLALKSSFGTFYPPNISSHPEDGIGAWTEAQFITALVKGTAPNRTHYYPVFPYAAFQRMTFGDLRDLFAHIKTLPAVQGKVLDHDVPIRFKIPRLLGIWKLLFLDGEPFTPDPRQSAQWNRGAYLVNGPAHCAECHSPRNFLGGIKQSQRFGGGPDPEGLDWVPNITPRGIGDWSEKDVANMLETGDLPDGDRVGGAMVKVVRNTAQLSADDRAAIAVYIKSLPPVEGPQPPRRE